MMLGKRPAYLDKRDFKLKDYMYRTKFPSPPKEFGHEQMIDKWGMLGNDIAGNCVFAGAAHEQMIWAAEGGKQVEFTTQTVLSDYAAVTGYNPDLPYTDKGTYVRDALKYRRRVGMLGADGQRHKIDAYVALDPGNVDELLIATYLFGTVGIGITLTEGAMKQYAQGKVWSRICNTGQDLGGHYVNVVAKRGRIYCVTWGGLQALTAPFYRRYNDEAWCMLSLDMFNQEGKTLEGFDVDRLYKDLAALGE